MPHAQPGAAQRDAQAAIPLLFGEVGRALEHRVGGIMNQDIEPPEALARRGDQRLPGGGFGHIAHHCGHLAAGRANMLGGLLQLLGAPMVVDHQARALLREAIGGRRTDPAPAGTGHDRDLAIQTHTGASSCLLRHRSAAGRLGRLLSTRSSWSLKKTTGSMDGRPNAE